MGYANKRAPQCTVFHSFPPLRQFLRHFTMTLHSTDSTQVNRHCKNLLTNTLEYSNLERSLSNIFGTKQLLALLPSCTSSPLVVCKWHLLGDGGTIQVAVRPLSKYRHFRFLDCANRADLRLVSALELIIVPKADTSLISARSIVCVPPLQFFWWDGYIPCVALQGSIYLVIMAFVCYVLYSNSAEILC